MSKATNRPLTLVQKVTRAAVKAVPQAGLRWLGRKAPINTDGDRLAPEVTGMLRILNRLPVGDYSDKPVDKARLMLTEDGQIFAEAFESFAVEEDLEIPGVGGVVPATRYRAKQGTPRGLIVYFHGGGFVLGNRISIETAVRFLALHTGADVLSVDYRLAPEHPFPAAIEDAMAAWQFAVERAPGWGIDPRRLVVAGDSAGGNMSATISQLLRGQTYEPCLQVLIYPALDLSKERPSHAEFADGYLMTRKQYRWFLAHYLAHTNDALDPRASPLLADDVSGVAPAYVAVAGFDQLRDEGIEYAGRLREAGVPVTLHRAAALVHGYVNATAFSPTARAATLHAAEAIVTALSAPLSTARNA